MQPQIDHSGELELAMRIADGDIEAWHEFVGRYADLVHGLTARFLGGFDEDERRTVYVAVLASLYEGGLARFDGRASLSTWIGVVTRSRCMDHLRKRHRRHQMPEWLASLSAQDQTIFRLHYVEGLDYLAICERFSGNGSALSMGGLVEALDRIESRIDRGARRRLDYERQARSVGAVSGHLLEYFQILRSEIADRRAAMAPDRILFEEDQRRRVKAMRVAIASLNEEERAVLECRFERGRTAQQTSQILGLSGQRRVYTIVDGALRKLRKLLEVEEDGNG